MDARKSRPPSAEPPRVGDTLSALRQASALSLDALSRKAGVSKSMLSQIERGQANPTVAVVWRLANALNVGMADLLGATPPAQPARIEVLAAHAAPAIRSPDGLCELRILGPVGLAGQFEWYALSVRPGGMLDSQPHEAGAQEHLSTIAGVLDVQAGDQLQRIKPGETARYAADQPHCIGNTGKTVATGWLVVVHPA
ncbi:MAG: XRE family transcriptional regulator [Burkholderiaceae bacterium]